MSDITVKVDENGVDCVEYEPVGVCSKLIRLKIKDGIILDAEFVGGCPGNLFGISKLVAGMNISEVSGKFAGIPCGNKSTSCPDQLSICLNSYMAQKQMVKA